MAVKLKRVTINASTDDQILSQINNICIIAPFSLLGDYLNIGLY